MEPDFTDTPCFDSPELIEMIRKLTREERAERFFALCQFAREMQWTGIKLRNPGLSDEEVTEKFRAAMFEYYARERADVE